MKTKFKINNWAKYNKSLINRGNIFLYFEEAAIAQWHNGGGGTCGRPRKYSNAAIEIFLMIRILFHLPLRQTQGFVECLIQKLLLPIECPHYTLVCRRARELKKKTKMVIKNLVRSCTYSRRWIWA